MRGPQYRPQYTIVLIIGAPKMYPLFWETPIFLVACRPLCLVSQSKEVDWRGHPDALQLQERILRHLTKQCRAVVTLRDYKGHNRVLLYPDYRPGGPPKS